MRRPLLPRHLALAGAAFSILAAGSAASMTLFGDRAAIHFNPSTSTQGTMKGQGAPPILTNQQTHPAAPGGQPASGSSAQAGELGTAAQAAGPTIFEQQIRAQEPNQISAGPTIFEQQVRAQLPTSKSGPGPITRGPGPVLH